MTREPPSGEQGRLLTGRAPGVRRIGVAWARFDKGAAWLSRMFAYLGAAAIFLSIIVILREAVGRYFFDAPTTFAVPLVGVLMVVILYFSIAYTASTEGHVSSDIIYSKLPNRGKATVLLVSDLAAGILGFLLAQQALGQVQRSMAIDAELRELWNLPQAVPESFIVIGGALLVLVTVAKAPIHVASLVTGESLKGDEDDTLRAEDSAEVNI